MNSVSVGGGVTVVLTWLVATGPACAHHSFLGRFDRESMIEVEGEVTAVSWRNPHASFVVKTADGAPIEWEVEGPSASLLNRLGIARDLIEVGERIRFAGYPPVGDKKEIYARHALLADGRELLLDSRIKPRWTQSALGERSILARTEGDPSRPDLGLFRVWTLIRSGPRLIPEDVDPSFDMASYPLTEAAQAAVAAFDRVADNPTRDCAPKGMPTIMEQPYPIEFERRADGNLALHIEEYDLVRTIYMAPNAAPADNRASLLGVSAGRWEGDTLVVTTDRIDWPYFDQLGIPQSNQSELLERFRPTENGARLDYRLTIIDPVYFSEPVVLENYWIWVPEIDRLPYDCATD